MKKIVIIPMFLALLTVSLQAQKDTTYDRALERYDQGSFEDALDLFRTVEKSGHSSALLYYNMGNAAFRSNKIGYAVLYYEKALKEDPGFEDAKENLRYVSRYKEDQLEAVPELFIRTWIKNLVRIFSSGTWALIAAVLFVAILLTVFLYVFSGRLFMRKAGFFGALVFLILFIFSLLSGIKQYQREKQADEGIIIDPSVIVRSTPNASGNELFILHEGTKVKLLLEVSGWQNIRITDGRVGWIEQEVLEEI